MTENTIKNCLACDKPIHGRSDKKFCNDYCRNSYNNQMKTMNSSSMKDINNVLVKNRKVLETALGEKEMEKTTKEKLLQSGLNFKYITHTYTNKKGNTYCFCYEYGYLPLENDWYLIVKRKDDQH
jgi:predicted nucleic acid-binding Zn ribbon protein